MRSGTLDPAFKARTYHLLTEVDIEAKTAVCSLCGPTKIRVRQSGRGHQCQTLRKKERDRGNRPNRTKRLRQKYGLVAGAFEALIEAQGGGCPICSTPLDATNGVVDHDHSCCPERKSCGQCVRGILCGLCNLGLGSFRDDSARLDAAKRYLQR